MGEEGSGMGGGGGSIVGMLTTDGTIEGIGAGEHTSSVTT